MSRTSFTTAASSEKLVLATVNAKARLYTFTGSGPVYTKQVPYFVTEIKQDDTVLTQVETDSVTAGQWHYDIESGLLTLNPLSDVAPDSVEVIVTYKLFFSDKGITLPHDLQNISEDVYWQGRIKSSPGYNHKIGIDQALTSLVGQGTLKLQNNDGGLDSVFDTLIFENQDVVIYSYSPTLAPVDAKVIYRGRITNKTYDVSEISFTIKDQIFSLLDSPSLPTFVNGQTINGVTIDINSAKEGAFIRRLYGRCSGVRGQSLSEFKDGYEIIAASGTFTITAESATLTTNATFAVGNVLSTFSQGDRIFIGPDELEIERVVSNTQITLTQPASVSITTDRLTLKTDRPNANRNRTFVFASHQCARLEKQVVQSLQFNRFRLADTIGLFPGDFVTVPTAFGSETVQIRAISADNVVSLWQNLRGLAFGTVTRNPIQEVFIRGVRVRPQDYNQFNIASGIGLTFTFPELALAPVRVSQLEATFTNGSRTVSFTNAEVSLDEVFSPGDYIRPDSDSITDFLRVVNVLENSIEVDTAYSGTTATERVLYKQPLYIEDNTPVSANIIGATVDNTESGLWIRSASQAIKDLIVNLGVDSLNNASFTQGEADSPQLISLMVPEEFNSKSLPSVKDLVDKLCKSTNSSVTLDNDLLLKFATLNVCTDEDLPEIRDFDVIGWKLRTVNGKAFNRVFGRHRFQDVSNANLEKGNRATTFESEFVNRYIGTKKVDEIDNYLFEDVDAEAATQRWLYYNRLSVATLTIDTDLRLEALELGQQVIIDLNRMYQRFGSEEHNKKIMTIIGKTVTGQKTQLILSDLGNTFNTSAFITPDDALDYADATDNQRIIYGYITDSQGIVDDLETTANTNLIS